MNLLEIKRYKDGKEVKEPQPLAYHEETEEYEFATKDIENWHEATPYRVAVTCVEYWKRCHLGLGVDEKLLSYKDCNWTYHEYVKWADQEPTEDNCKGLVVITTECKMVDAWEFFKDRDYDSFEQAQYYGLTILIPLDKEQTKNVNK